MAAKAWALRHAGMGGLLALGACGGGGGGIQSSPPPPPVAITPAPTPTPTPAPTPTPTPTPVAGTDTPEYRSTVGAVSMNALAAYNVGATGAGAAIAIIDSGFDLQSAELEGRLSSASQPLAGNTSIDDVGGHGTAVAFTAAGRRNGAGTHGVAYGATVIAYRADRPGSCAEPETEESEGGCRFGTDAIGQGVDAARVAGARVINISLGGSEMPFALQQAIGRATAAGIVVVIAAGNDGTDNPDPFTNVANTPNANGAIIVAGSVGSADGISSFSDKAGKGAATFLAAVGERVRAPNQDNVPRLWSGTSFAAPQISGAVALLAQAFPNLTGADIVRLLLTTARDAGAPGTDAVYGRGILDLARAFRPVGASTVAGMTASVSTTGGSTGWTAAPIGDARSLGVGAVILDGFERAFAIDLAESIGRAAPARPLGNALTGSTRHAGFAVGGTAVSMTLAPIRDRLSLEPTRLTGRDADAARAIAGSVTQRLGANTGIAFGIRQGSAGLSAQLAGARGPAFLVAHGDATGFDTAAGSSVAVRHRLGGFGVTAAAEAGAVLSPRERPDTRYWQRTPYDRLGLAVDRRVGPITATAAVTRLGERDTLLGSRLDAALGNPGAVSWFADMGARFDGGGWTLGAHWRQGRTQAQVRGLAGSGRLRTAAWSADIGKAGVLGGDLGLRVAQPLRVASGGLDLTLPTAWDYATRSVGTYTTQRLNLAPSGRELDIEARYAFRLAGGVANTNLYWRHDPGNVAALADDYGAALRWSWGF